MDDVVFVTSALWLPREVQGAVPGARIWSSPGLDIPGDASRFKWWCSMGFANRLLSSGVNAKFSVLPPDALASLPTSLTHRRVSVLRAGMLIGIDHPVHVKPAVEKLPRWPARVSRGPWPVDNPSFLVQVSEPVVFEREWRVFLVNDEPVASSIYLDHGVTWDALEASPAPASALSLASEVADRTGARCVDIGLMDDGQWAVVEMNPAWASNPYHSDRAGFLEAVMADQGTGRWPGTEALPATPLRIATPPTRWVHEGV